jgi:hypothetical protein
VGRRRGNFWKKLKTEKEEYGKRTTGLLERYRGTLKSVGSQIHRLKGDLYQQLSLNSSDLLSGEPNQMWEKAVVVRAEKI